MSNQWQDPYTPPQFEQKVPVAGAPQVMPAAIKVFGIINLVMAAFGLFGTCFSLLPFIMDLKTPNPVLDMMKENQFYRSYTIFSIILSFVLVSVLGIGGIGLLQNRLWGRTLSMIYAIAAIVTGLVGIMISYLYLVQPMLEKANQMAPGPEKAAMQVGAIGGMFGGCFGLIYPVILLVFMTRPRIVQALRQASGK